MSLRSRVESMCKACIFDPDADGTWRDQVSRCTSPRCPLFDVRPRPIKVAAKPMAAVRP